MSEKITKRDFRSERRRSAGGSDGTGKRGDCGMGAPRFETANGRSQLNKQSWSDHRMTGSSAKLTNVRARAFRGEIGTKMELRSQQKKSKKNGQATAARAAGAHKSTAIRIRKIRRLVNNNRDRCR